MFNEHFNYAKVFGQFWAFFGPKFCSKIRFLDIFFETAHQICLKLGQKLGTIALNHWMAVLCLGKFLFWPFWPFLGKKYIACGDIWFWAVLGNFFPNRWWFFEYLLFKLSCLFINVQWTFQLCQSFWPVLGLFWAKIFRHNWNVFLTFLNNQLSINNKN